MFDPKTFVYNARKAGKQASIVMVTFNRWGLTRQSLLSIFKNTFLPHVLTVVDNASWDGTQEKLKYLRSTSKIDKLILLPKNMGIGQGKNFGLKSWEDNADWHCCIDNDVVVSPYWLSYLCYASMLPELGVVGCNVQEFGTRYKWFIPSHWKTVNGVVLDNCPNPGGIYVMSDATFRKLGYFREMSLYGLEDSELHSRQRHHGLRSAYVRNVDCKELADEDFKMKNGQSYREFKTDTHRSIVAEIKQQAKEGVYEDVKHYQTHVTTQEVEQYSWRP